MKLFPHSYPNGISRWNVLISFRTIIIIWHDAAAAVHWTFSFFVDGKVAGFRGNLIFFFSHRMSQFRTGYTLILPAAVRPVIFSEENMF